MSTVSGTTFFGGKVPPPPVATSSPTAPKSSLAQDVWNSISSSVGSAASSGAQQAVSGYNQAKNASNPLQLLEGSAGLATGAIGTAFSPLAPVFKPVGDTINAIGDQIGNNKSLQKFTQDHPVATSNIMRGAQDVSNLATIAGAVAGTKVPKAIGSVVDETFTQARDVADLYKTTKGNKPVTSAAKTLSGNIVKDVTPTTERLVNSEVTKALDLTAGDVKNINLSTGNEVGKYMADNNLIGNNLADTQKLLQDHFDTNYKTVRSEIDKVTTQYGQNRVPAYTETLQHLKDITKDVVGQHEANAEITTLLNKERVSLADIQHAKELVDRHLDLFKATGEEKAGVVKGGFANDRAELQSFIEKEVKKSTGADIHNLNNQVTTSKGILDAIEARSTSGYTRSMFTPTDAGALTAGAVLGGPVGAGVAFVLKKIYDSPSFKLTVSKWLDGLNDKRKAQVEAEFQAGKIPAEVQKMIQEDLPSNQSPTESSNANGKISSQTKNTTKRSIAPSIPQKGSLPQGVAKSSPLPKSTTLISKAKQAAQNTIADIKKNGQRGFVANPFKEGLPIKVINKLTPVDKGLMTKYIDSVRVKGAPKLTKAEELDLAKTDELLGINPDQSAETIAKQYEQVIPKIKDPQPRTDQGKYYSPKGEGAIPKELEPLAKEAQKYSSAEEFVKAQGKTIYHGTDFVNEIEKSGFKVNRNLKKNSNYVGDDYLNGTYFTRNKSLFKEGGQLEQVGGVIEAKLPKNLKIEKINSPKDIEDLVRDQLNRKVLPPSQKYHEETVRLTTEYFQKLGIDGIEIPSSNELIIFNPENIKTKSQLTDFYNKVKGKK